MCKVVNYIMPGLVFARMKAEDRVDLIRTLAKQIERIAGLDSLKVVDAILEREQYGTTGIGNGVAIPHGRIKGMRDIVLVLATVDQPLDYGAIDGEKVSLIFMLIVPEGNNLVYLKLLSRISVLCNDKHVRNRLISAGSPEELLDILRSVD